MQGEECLGIRPRAASVSPKDTCRHLDVRAQMHGYVQISLLRLDISTCWCFAHVTKLARAITSHCRLAPCHFHSAPHDNCASVTPAMPVVVFRMAMLPRYVRYVLPRN